MSLGALTELALILSVSLMGIFPVVEVTLDSAVLGGLQLIFLFFIRVSEFFSVSLLFLVE